MHDVTIGIVSYNRPALLDRLLRSIRRQFAGTVVIVDTGSDFESLRAIRETSSAHACELHVSSQRSSWTAAINRLLAMCETEYIAFFDDDHEVTKSWGYSQVELLASKPRVAGVGCRFLESDGSLQKGFPVLGPRCHAIYIGQDTIRPFPCQFVPLGGGIYRCSALRSVAGMDEAYFLAHADIDLSYRLRYEGNFRLLYDPAASVYHHKQLLEHEANTIRAERVWRDYDLFVSRWKTVVLAEVEPALSRLRHARFDKDSAIFFRSDFAYRGESGDFVL